MSLFFFAIDSPVTPLAIFLSPVRLLNFGSYPLSESISCHFPQRFPVIPDNFSPSPDQYKYIICIMNFAAKLFRFQFVDWRKHRKRLESGYDHFFVI